MSEHRGNDKRENDNSAIGLYDDGLLQQAEEQRGDWRHLIYEPA